VKRFLRVLAPFIILAFIFCIPSVTEKLPEPIKTAFTDLRENTIKVSRGDGFGSIKWNNPRGMYESAPGNGIEHGGGR
jgi:hypothetical protein